MLNALLDDREDIVGIVCVPERFQKKTAGYDDLSDIAEKHAIPIFKSRRLHVKKCKKFISQKDDYYFDLNSINNIKNPILSIIMTSYNRSRQTYYTLSTIAKSG